VSRRKLAVVGLAVIALGAGGVAALVRGGAFSHDSLGDVGGFLGLVDDPPFAIKLGGPLWLDRTLQDGEGAPDVARLTADEPLRATIRGIGTARLAQVELRVNGRTQRRIRPSCPGGKCPRIFSLTLVPRLNVRVKGNRHVQLIARDGGGGSGGTDEGAHVSVASLRVRVLPRFPGVTEAEPPSSPRGAAALDRPALSARARRAALRLLAPHPGLRTLLGGARTRVRAAGTLRDGRRAIGVTLLLELPISRRDAVATVPGYVAARNPQTPYVARTVSLHVKVLRDLLVDVDLVRHRVIDIEPGPRSVTKKFTPDDPRATEKLAADADTVLDTANRPPLLIRISDGGPSFLGYDGAPDLNAHQRDWSVSLVFAGGASVGKVKAALRRVAYTRRGISHYLAYRRPGAGLRFDGDKGLKTRCDRAGTDVHLRMYAPAEVDHFTDPELGSVVVATTHLDHAEPGCSTGPARFGFSEDAERRVAAAARRLGWRVQPDWLSLGNAEPYRRDVRDPAHLWLSNGRATVIWVP
jgi:hypothetical protein